MIVLVSHRKHFIYLTQKAQKSRKFACRAASRAQFFVHIIDSTANLVCYLVVSHFASAKSFCAFRAFCVTIILSM